MELAVVVGGGNFIRGSTFSEKGHIPRATADYMGMLATILNAMALQETMEKMGQPTRVLSAIGVYSVCEYGGTTVSATFGEDITLFAYGNGTYSVTSTNNTNRIITTNNTDTGTYTIAADGTLTLIDSKGELYNGAIAADGNALVLASVTSTQSPAVFAGVRQ